MILGYAGFLRYNEISQLTLGDLEFHGSYLKVFILSSKTDQYKEGRWLYIAKSNAKMCSVLTVLKYIQRAKIVEEEEYLFRGVVYRKSMQDYELRKKKKPTNYCI